MYPDSNDIRYTNPQEYLDQISPKKRGRFSFLDKKTVILIIAIVLLIITVIIFVAVNSNPSTPSTKLLAVRAQNMNTLLEYDTSKITDAKYKKAIAETRVIFASNNFQLSQSFGLTIDPVISLQEPIEPTIAELDEASAKNSLTSEYVSILVAQLNQIINTLEEIEFESSNSIIQQALLDLYELSDRFSSN